MSRENFITVLMFFTDFIWQKMGMIAAVMSQPKVPQQKERKLMQQIKLFLLLFLMCIVFVWGLSCFLCVFLCCLFEWMNTLLILRWGNSVYSTSLQRIDNENKQTGTGKLREQPMDSTSNTGGKLMSCDSPSIDAILAGMNLMKWKSCWL